MINASIFDDNDFFARGVLPQGVLIAFDIFGEAFNRHRFFERQSAASFADVRHSADNPNCRRRDNKRHQEIECCNHSKPLPLNTTERGRHEPTHVNKRKCLTWVRGRFLPSVPGARRTAKSFRPDARRVSAQ